MSYGIVIVASTVIESVADQVLYSCHMLKSVVYQATQLSVVMETNNNKANQFEVLQVSEGRWVLTLHKGFGAPPFLQFRAPTLNQSYLNYVGLPTFPPNLK